MRRTLLIGSLLITASMLVGMAVDVIMDLPRKDAVPFTMVMMTLVQSVSASLPQSYAFRHRYLAPLTMPIGVIVPMAVTIPLICFVGDLTVNGLDATLRSESAPALAAALLFGLVVTCARPQGRLEALTVHVISTAIMAAACTIDLVQGPAWAMYGLAISGCLASLILSVRAMPPCPGCVCAD